MDGHRFDAISRRLAAGVSRRAAVKGAVAGMVGILGLRSRADAQVTQAQCGNETCARNPGRCNDGCVCCVYANSRGRLTNSRCRPPGACGPGATLCRDGSPADPVRGCEPECTGDDDCESSETCRAGTCVDRCLAAGCPCAACAATTDGLVCGGVGIQCQFPCASPADCIEGEVCFTSEGNLIPQTSDGCVPPGEGRCGVVTEPCPPA